MCAVETVMMCKEKMRGSHPVPSLFTAPVDACSEGKAASFNTLFWNSWPWGYRRAGQEGR